jgi:hypothetical protein
MHMHSRSRAAAAAAALLALVAGSGLAANIAITSPAQEETVHDNSGKVTVTVDAVPGPRERVRLLIDGKPAAPDSRRGTFALSGIDRGEHRLQAQLLDADDRVVAESAPVTFYMWQASSQFPSRNN